MTLPPRSTQEQQRVETAIRKLFENQITFNHYLGLTVDELSAQQVTLGFSMRDEFIGHYLHGRLHGGVISTALDAVGGLAVLWAIAQFHRHENAQQVLSRFAHLGTIDLRVDYLRQGIGEQFLATAKVSRLGRRIASTQMQLENNDGKLLASGNATYIVS